MKMTRKPAPRTLLVLNHTRKLANLLFWGLFPLSHEVDIMQLDLYSRVMLTVIAMSLLWIGLNLTTRAANAQASMVTIDNELLKVVICNEKGSRCADVSYGGKIEVDVD